MRNPNPYKGIDWSNQIRVVGSTHLHCSTAKEFNIAIRDGLEFATFSNYYPSAPYYPLASIRENTFRRHQNAYIRNGKAVHEPIDFTEVFKEIGADTSIIPPDDGAPLFPKAPDYLLEAPNAEHHFFTDFNVYLHITSPGSLFTSGCYYTRGRNGILDPYGISIGTQMPWREAFREMLDGLMIPDGGGIIINHPNWSHLPVHSICEMLDFDDRVLGLEAINFDSNSTYCASGEGQWDAVLGTGRQCFGFCTQDHIANETFNGRSIILPEERTAESCLRAYQQGRFYGAALGHGLNFECIEFDGRTIHVRTDKEAVILLISNQGVVVELWTGRELVYTVPDEERSKHVFFRVTAEELNCHEKLFTQPFMLV
ncbi:MAG: hypothetical protein MJ106_06055 [Lentisphaeria bacterium]|nr:hypothetical protein [Lentisphaeria bacterium]